MSEVPSQVQTAKAEEAAAVQPTATTTAAEAKPVVPQTPAAPEVAKPAETKAPEPAAPIVEQSTKPAPTETAEPDEASETKEASAEPAKPAAPVSALSKLLIELPTIIKAADYNEMWGVTLTDSANHVPTSIVLEKFLRANNQDVSKAKTQLTEALSWRKKMQPQKLLEASYDHAKFGGLGYVTTYPTDAGKEIVTFNIYGAVKDKKATFGNIEEFMRWRCALMEISVRELDLASKTVPIPEGGNDPYRTIQVHDYLSISFLRQDPATKAATRETISTFSMAYPELLKEKFFVNIPLVMGWMFAAMKLILPPATVKKFHPLSYGSSLAGEIPQIGDKLPNAYGGKGGKLEDMGETPKYTEKAADKAPEKTPEKEMPAGASTTTAAPEC